MHFNEKRLGSKPFDPHYDPLTARTLGPGSDYAPTYWIGTAGAFPEDDGPVTADMEAEAVVIGSGYTGLSAAIHLAKMHGIKATVLEANGVAYGCSTRNGGQAQISSGRLKRSQWIERWGGADAIAGVTACPCCCRGLSLDSPAVRVAVFAVQGGSFWELRLPWRSLEELEARRDPKMIEVVPRPGASRPGPTEL